MDFAGILDTYLGKGINRGSRIDWTNLPHEKHAFYDEYLQRAVAALGSVSRIHSKLPSIYADFVSHSGFSPSAVRFQDQFFIVYKTGLPEILKMVMSRILADHRLFPEVGDPKMEVQDLPSFQLAFPPDALWLSNANPMAGLPKDPARHLYAKHICHLAFDFMTAHEIAHIANGHLGYMVEERGIPYVSEVDFVSGTPEGNLELQAMELDADSTASRALVNGANMIISSRDHLNSDIAALYQNPENVMYDISVAISVVFRLFQDHRMVGVDYSEKRHPPTRWRQMQILNMMGNHADNHWGSEIVKSVEAGITKAIADVERAFESITDTPQQVQGLHDAWNGDGWQYLAIVSNCWNGTVRAKVAKYAFIEPDTYHFDQPQFTSK